MCYSTLMAKKINLKNALKLSIALNILLLVGVILYLFTPIIVGDKLTIAQLGAIQQYYCEDHYRQMLDKLGSEGADPTRTKMVYALTTCLKNYKTGQSLDLKPLVDQINQTDPKTSY